MKSQEELEIISLIKSGDPAAESELIKTYYNKVRLILGVRVTNQEDLVELVNDVLLATILKIKDGSFDPCRGTPLSTYINGIIQNTISQYYRDYYKEYDRTERLEEHISEKMDYIKQVSARFEYDYDLENKKNIWRNLIENLRPKYKEVVYLRFYEDKSVNEISEIMKISPQKVSDYIKYAKQLLLKELSKKKYWGIMKNFFQIFLFFTNI